MLLSGLMLIACIFLFVVAPVGSILMVKVFSKVSVENWFNHCGKNYFSCQCLLFQVIQILVTLWFQSQWIVGVFVAFVQMFHNPFQNN